MLSGDGGRLHALSHRRHRGPPRETFEIGSRETFAFRCNRRQVEAGLQPHASRRCADDRYASGFVGWRYVYQPLEPAGTEQGGVD